MNNFGLSDKDIFDDVLSSQKQITGIYDTFSNECVNQQLRNDMLMILNDEHQIQSDVFFEMQKRGWQSPACAQAEMINQTRTKFEGIASQL